MCENASCHPTYPFRRVLTEEEAARAKPLQIVRMGAYLFAQLPSGWVLVDTPADPRETDDA
jgi:hypothetical protein